MNHVRGVLKDVMEEHGIAGVTVERLLAEHRKGCHKAGVFKDHDAQRAVFLAQRDFKRAEKIRRRISHG